MAMRCTAHELVKKNLSFDSPRSAVGSLSYWKEIAHIRTKHGLSETQGKYMKNPKDSKKAILITQWTVTLHPLAEHELQTIPADMQDSVFAHR